jgi:phosphoribosyl-AMP cyclohydrolase / phosphoribosyl-ATP pyrophosphohydrolase
MTIHFDASAIDWSKCDGLIPVIVQDARSLRVLMLGYVNKESMQATLDTGLVTFFSRSKQRLWQKGETSGHVLRLRDIRLDCDGDALLISADPEGPTCHLGTQSCFGDEEGPSLATLAQLAKAVHARRVTPQPDSYTSKLFAQGVSRIAQKVGEEAVETALSAGTQSPTLPDEAADLLYHLLVLLEASGTDWMDVIKVLHDRAQTKRAK